jgi:hypothetical protein
MNQYLFFVFFLIFIIYLTDKNKYVFSIQYSLSIYNKKKNVEKSELNQVLYQILGK